MSLKNKKNYLVVGSMVVLASLVFIVSALPASAAGCEENSKQSYFLSAFNPIISFAEKTLKGFGYDVTLAAAPDPDICGSDSVACSGATPTATINWTAAPQYYRIGFSYLTLDYYILAISGVGIYDAGKATSFTVSPGLYKCPSYNNTNGQTFVCGLPYTCNGQLQTGSSCIGSNHGDPCYYYHTYPCVKIVSSGLVNNTTYNWSVNAYYQGNLMNATNKPSGSFTTLNCQSLTVDLTTNPTSGNAPLGVSFYVSLGGTAQGTVNYHFWDDCSDTTTSISQAESLCGVLPTPNAGECAWDWDSNGRAHGRCLAVSPLDPSQVFAGIIYYNPGDYKAKLIVERGTASAAQDQENILVAVPVNNPPSVSNLSVNGQNYCVTPYHLFSWTYSDLDGDPQTRFDFQVDNDSNFNSPEVNRTINTSAVNQSVIVSVPTIADQLNYNTAYYWRVRVYDGETDSGWVNGPSFTTESHQYPDVNFSWDPSQPAIDQETIFTDLTTVYSSTKSAWAWTFEGGNPASSNIQAPIVRFSSAGDKQIILEVTDSDGYTCPSNARTLRVAPELPGWEER